MFATICSLAFSHLVQIFESVESLLLFAFTKENHSELLIDCERHIRDNTICHLDHISECMT